MKNTNYLLEDDVIELVEEQYAPQIQHLEHGHMQDLIDAGIVREDTMRNLWYWKPGTQFKIGQLEIFNPEYELEFYVSVYHPEYYFGYISGYMKFPHVSVIKIVRSGKPLVYGLEVAQDE